MNLTIIYQDERIIAVSKPCGQATVPGSGLTEEPLSAEVSRVIGKKAFVVHRLDREASGLVVFAKDAAVHKELCLAFESRKVHKTYLAAVLGRVEKDGEVGRPIREFGSGRMGVASSGKPSLTRYAVKEAGADWSFLQIEPETGRRHQIRVHLWSIGHPILGDRVYGKNRPVGGAPRLMLHALEISFADQKIPVLRAEPSEEFLTILGQLPRAGH